MGNVKEMVTRMLERAKNVTAAEIHEANRRLNASLGDLGIGEIDLPPLTKNEEDRPLLFGRRPR